MSWFKRKDDNLIPPVQPAGPPPSRSPAPGNRGLNSNSPRPPAGFRSNANSYNASRDGDPYNPPSRPNYSGYNDPPENLFPAGGSGRNTPQRAGSRGLGDPYARGGNADADRNELFAGYNPENAGQNRFVADGPGPRPMRDVAPGEEEEDDIEGIKQNIRFTKQESVNSTRNALRLAREAEETARGTVLKLGDQSGMSYHP